jgi:hypothetical protein
MAVETGVCASWRRNENDVGPPSKAQVPTTVDVISVQNQCDAVARKRDVRACLDANTAFQVLALVLTKVKSAQLV